MKYDSNYGTFEGEIEVQDDGFVIDGKKIKVFAERDPANIPWKDLGVDIVLESTGRFRDKDKAVPTLNQAGPRKWLSQHRPKGKT